MENIAQLTAEKIHRNQVTLAMPSTGDATRLQQFIRKVGDIFAARILSSVGSWKETLITLELDEPIPAEEMVNKLVKMPEVEEAQEKRLKKKQGATPTGILVILSKSSAIDDYEPGEPTSRDEGILTTQGKAEGELHEVAKTSVSPVEVTNLLPLV